MGLTNIAGAIIAGILGTIAMVASVLASPTRTGMFKLDLAGYVGLMFTANPNLARLIGLAILTFNGAVLAIVSAFLWDNNIGSATWLWGVIFGAVLGCLSLLVMLILDRIHPRPGDTEVASLQTIGVILWLGHVVCGLITVLVYNAFQSHSMSRKAIHVVPHRTLTLTQRHSCPDAFLPWGLFTAIVGGKLSHRFNLA